MNEQLLFGLALGLSNPWKITKVVFEVGDSGNQELHITIGCDRGTKFLVDGNMCPVYDHQERTWRHLNFFQHVCYLHCSVPRVTTSEGRKSLVDVPWAEKGSSFTLLFEAYSMLLVKSGMSLSAAGRYMKIDSRIIERIIKFRVYTALIEEDLAPVEHLGIDETSISKGHKYITVLTDVGAKKVVGISAGKGIESVESALQCMEIRGADKQEISVATIDLSPAYISAVASYLPHVDVVFDRFHVTALLNKAVDEIRREDQKENAEIKKTRYLWLKGKTDLSTKNQAKISYLAETYPRIGTAYRLKEQFREIWNEKDSNNALATLIEWANIAWDSGLAPMMKFVKTLESHWFGIETYFKRRVSNGYAEATNLKIQEVKRLAKGYSNIGNFMVMIYFHLGGLNLGLPTKYS